MATLVVGIGYIGSRLVQELLYQGREVVGIDNLFSSDRRAIEAFGQSPGFRFVEGSIVDPITIDRAISASAEIDVVYLLAAQASANADAASPEYTEEANLRGPRVILDGLLHRRVGAPVVYASSLRVYGSPLPAFVDETTPYGAFADLSHLSKCYAEKLIEMYASTRQIRGRAVRLGLTYGVAPVLKTDPRFMTAPNLFCLRAARGEPIDVRTRDHFGLIHVDDAVQSLMAVGEQRDAKAFQVFNAAPDIVRLTDVADAVGAAAVAHEVPFTVEQRPFSGALDRPAPSVKSALTNLGFSPRRQLAEGIAETFDHFLVHGQ